MVKCSEQWSGGVILYRVVDSGGINGEFSFYSKFHVHGA